MKLTRTIDLSKIRDVELDSVTISAVNADDMIDASARCIPPDGASLDGNLFNLMLRHQLVAQSIVDYTPRSGDKAGQKVICNGSVCLDSLTWGSRTREFVGEIFDHLNGIQPSEREDFRRALTSPSTPGSPGDASAE